MKKGFTLLEILIVIAIAGIVAGIGFPMQKKMIEKSRAGEAISNLRSILLAEQTYRVSNGEYYPKGPSVATQSTLSTINTALKTRLESYYYDLSITNTIVSSKAAGFTATATRNGIAGGQSATITVNESGVFGGNSVYKP